MKGVFSISITLIISSICLSQVGIRTTHPSQAAVLEIASTSNNIDFGGFMPPRVASQVQRDMINATSIDNGLLVFVESTGTLEIWNGIYWEIIYTLSIQAQTLAYQDFDTNLTWNYSVTPDFYATGLDIWDTVSSLGSGTGEIDRVSDIFLGCRDLENPNGGGTMFHEIAFDNVAINSITNVRIAFDYDVVEFDNGDDVRYEVFYDNIGQGQVLLINGAADYSEEGTVVINIPGSVSQVRLTLGIKQNGESDFAAFDNFRVYGQ